MKSSFEKLEKEIHQIKERNKRVEADKSWETSKARKIIISIATYIIIGLFLAAARIPDPWLSALIPSLAFILSTLTLPMVKELWVKHFYRNKGNAA